MINLTLIYKLLQIDLKNKDQIKKPLMNNN